MKQSESSRNQLTETLRRLLRVSKQDMEKQEQKERADKQRRSSKKTA